MSSQASDLVEVERAREKFLSAGILDAGESMDAGVLPANIVESWRRSQFLRVCPDRVELPYVGEPDKDSRLACAAAPVLQSVTDDLAAQAVSVVLTSTNGVVLERSAAEVSILHALDKVGLAPGYSLAEDVAGTNGIGTTLETAQPAFIRGGEHYVAMFTGFTCAGAPIRDPVTGRLIGALNLSCLARQSDPVLQALATSAGRQIEDRMREVARETETALLEAYLRQTRRSSRGVLAMGGDVVLINPYLRRVLDGNEQAALVEHGADLLTSTLSRAALAVLPSGRIAKLTAADRTTLRDGRANVVFHVDLSAEAGSPTSRAGHPARTHIPGLAGRSVAWLRCCEQVRRCCQNQDWVIVEGEKGSGRSRLAQAVGQHVKPGRTVRVMRAGTFPNAASFVAELAAQSCDQDFAVVIADVDDIDKDTLEPITSMLAARAGHGWIAATTSGATPAAAITKLLLPLFTHTVRVPALRHRIEDLEELVPLLLRDISRGADVKMAPEAMHQLSRLPWPGNVAQLRRVLTETVARQRSGVINADMLPPECRSVTRRKLSQMEALERDAIVRSLRDNGGNKQDAARTLGMSRATIYRKINDYGIA
ncbi:sigma-54-dependent Fis family transcriptional regulator [Mycolicibacterium holsaticum]|uniref:sigma-54-dependent Fis family transcriptional regulator n=1 Tax=Mycolicibacterium holsaticum TaxID=152142 RepID=UPI001C7CDC11|nr:helix-turn-helix domain-containing protein [Mycolicibacterium holsaticum]MDA4106651.1 siderophore-interacting protein [Mycolicibacterium holsaticum DSM 44478 = JCM 12374]QZA13068.1 GAF domain-containing protein [Mycolicibacterium holsaticum DSM 44478 = JCM 12374]UNC09456.1 GAF domain-containing protein [Mycolicibacterium holsaticum DSM 44478 = JCM 12374]